MSESPATPKKALPTWLIILSFPITIPLVCVGMVIMVLGVLILTMLAIPATLVFDLCGRHDISERIAPETWSPL